MKLHPVAAHILLVDELAPLVEAELHNGANEIGARDDGRTDVRLLNMVNQSDVGQPRGVMHFLAVALLVVNQIRNVGHSGDDIHIELPVETLLNDFHMEQSQETAPETEP